MAKQVKNAIYQKHARIIKHHAIQKEVRNVVVLEHILAIVASKLSHAVK